MLIFICSGTVGRQPELRTTKKGEKVLSFSLAVDNGKRDGEKLDATWIDCSMYGTRAESLQPWINKGDKLSLSGKPSTRCYNEKSYQQLSIKELTFMGKAGQMDQETEPQDTVSADLDDQIPF